MFHADVSLYSLQISSWHKELLVSRSRRSSLRLKNAPSALFHSTNSASQYRPERMSLRASGLRRMKQELNSAETRGPGLIISHKY